MDWLNTFKSLGSYRKDGETISSYEKILPNEYRIVVNEYENEWGGKRIISVIPLPEIGEKDGIHHLRSPHISFFATGFEEFEELEKKIREEIVPALKKWAIKTI